MIWPALMMVVAFGAAPPPPSPAPEKSHICWIRAVHIQGHGVAIAFRPRQRGVRFRGGESLHFMIDPAAGKDMVDANGIHHVRAVSALPGDMLSVQASPEDSCSLTVVRQGRRLGVQARAAMHMPGLPPRYASEFIAAH